jgi:hypothetical protein
LFKGYSDPKIFLPQNPAELLQDGKAVQVAFSVVLGRQTVQQTTGIRLIVVSGRRVYFKADFFNRRRPFSVFFELLPGKDMPPGMIPKRNFRAKAAFPPSGLLRDAYNNIAVHLSTAGLAPAFCIFLCAYFFTVAALYPALLDNNPAFSAHTGATAGGINVQSGCPGRLEQLSFRRNPDCPSGGKKSYCAVLLTVRHLPASVTSFRDSKSFGAPLGWCNYTCPLKKIKMPLWKSVEFSADLPAQLALLPDIRQQARRTSNWLQVKDKTETSYGIRGIYERFCEEKTESNYSA